MPSSRYPVPEIQSWTPSLEVKAVENGAIFVLDGSKNYSFDSKGPKSNFGSYVLTGGPVDIGDVICQSETLGDRQLIFTDSAVYLRKWTLIDEDTIEPSTEVWVKIYDLPEVENGFYSKYHWTAAYVGHGSYVCHPAFGVFKYTGDGLTAHNPPGLPEYPIAITECSGRLIVMGRYVDAWSSPFSGDDFTPELGGAGFQSIAERVAGDPIALTSFQGGFLTHTTMGIMVSEFVGGDTVFRHDRVLSNQFILDPYAYTVDADGNLLYVTQQGLYKSNASSGLAPMTPIFNEFFRTEIGTYSEFRVSIKYMAPADYLFLQILDETSVVIRTYVLSIVLDKWGIFSPIHKGICQWTSEPSDFGYMDTDGYGHRFAEVPFIEKVDGTLEALDSKIELGYFRPASGGPNADLYFELHNILVSGVKKKTAAQLATEIAQDWGHVGIPYNTGFYKTDEDWNAFGVSDFDEDWNDHGASEDWNQSGVHVDYNDSVAGARDFDWNNSGPMEDWNATPEGGVDTDYIIDWGAGEGGPSVDWQPAWGGLNQLSYNITALCSLDGFETDVSVIPGLAVEKNESDLWSLLTAGHHHRVVFEANQVNQKFHVTHMEVTINSNGRLA